MTRPVISVSVRFVRLSDADVAAVKMLQKYPSPANAQTIRDIVQTAPVVRKLSA